MQSSRSLRLRSQAAIPGGGADSRRGTRALRGIEIVIATRLTGHFLVVYIVACSSMDELDDRAWQFRSNPNCTVEKIIIVTVTSLGWAWYLGRTITDNDGMNDYFLLAHAAISDSLASVQINYVSYSDMNFAPGPFVSPWGFPSSSSLPQIPPAMDKFLQQ